MVRFLSPLKRKGKQVISAQVPWCIPEAAFPLLFRFILHKLSPLSPGSFQNPGGLGTVTRPISLP
jgi:hypothetical protein